MVYRYIVSAQRFPWRALLRFGYPNSALLDDGAEHVVSLLGGPILERWGVCQEDPRRTAEPEPTLGKALETGH
jgi:hypothetical protein